MSLLWALSTEQRIDFQNMEHAIKPTTAIILSKLDLEKQQRDPLCFRSRRVDCSEQTGVEK